ncbi:MAG: endopeptidase La [Chloroflexaceae bacterium]|jgi:ATP-dependent Lon protease|nr:endopeptidase La [Chloroflexaceae bacterium]
MSEDSPVLFDFPSGRRSVLETPPTEVELPVLPLINTVLFPHMLTPLLVGRDLSVAAVEEAMASDRLILAVAQRDEELEGSTIAELYTVGVEAIIQRVLRMPDGSSSIVVQGQRRMRLLQGVQEQPSLRVRALPVYPDEERTLAVEAMMRAVLSLFEKVVKLSRNLPDDSYIMAMNVDEPGWLADLIASTMQLDVSSRQTILETIDPEERLRRLSVLLSQELDVLELESRIHTQVQREVDRSQREFFLREQLKVIQRELGEDDPVQAELNTLRERLVTTPLPEKARARAVHELSRLEMMPTMAPEYAVVRTYLDWLLDVPWSEATDDNLDLRAAAHILERNHYGLPKVKERILEFMAVRQLAGNKHRSPILCFVGPPGVGKTSLGRSIAEALERKFVRISLGGVHDEAEIRGHRRTYIGAMPGRILKTMKEAGSINPVFMLDEVDKLGNDFRGDPAAALLEVLDPEQNNTFSDHYLDVPYDLSKVLFITTANLTGPIPPALLDRMEVIELPGYIEEEKLEIARRFLIPKQAEANGLEPDTLRFTEPALRAIIQRYTYEAGVRNLEREIGTICRKTARRIAENRSYVRVVQPGGLEKFLGLERYSFGEAETNDQVGVATGMAYTSNGGDTMPVEVSVMEGKGTLLLTGSLGEIMEESAEAALSYARSTARTLGIEVRRFEKSDIHIHVPDSAVPKDGPSAGITLATALISALTGRAIRRDVAMTGEITLRGRVLPVGGIREKLLGAYRAGVTTIILPTKNRRDVTEVPTHVQRKLTLHFVEHMDEVLNLALLPAPPREPSKKKKDKSARTRGENGTAPPLELPPAQPPDVPLETVG